VQNFLAQCDCPGVRAYDSQKSYTDPIYQIVLAGTPGSGRADQAVDMLQQSRRESLAQR